MVRRASDATLVRKARNGSRDAAGELFGRYWPGAWRAALVLTGRREMADDVAQDAFERAFAALSRFDESRPFGAWLHRIVVNRALDLMRRERRLVGLDQVAEPESPWRDLDAEDRELLDAVATLGAQRRTVVVLRYGLGYSPTEIARAAGAADRHGQLAAGARARGSAADQRGGRCPPSLSSSSSARCARRPRRRPTLRGGPRWTRCRSPPRRRRGRVPLVLALGMAMLLASAVTLYASPDARQAVGLDTYTPKHPFKPGPKRLQVPDGASGIAVLAGGRMWATAHAVSINGAKATAVELSPNALNIAVGRGRDLVAVHTNGSGERVLRRTEGQVVAISWAPNPIEIAYVVKDGSHYRLHLIEGDGDNDRLIDPSVSPVRPTWSWDNGELAYVSSNGHVVVRDLIHARSTVLPRGCLRPRRSWRTHPQGTRWSPRERQRRGRHAHRARSHAARCPQRHQRPRTARPCADVAHPDHRRRDRGPRRRSAATHGSRMQVIRRLTESRGNPVGASALPGNRLVIALGGYRLRMIEVDANTLHIRRVLLDASPADGAAPVSLR